MTHDGKSKVSEEEGGGWGRAWSGVSVRMVRYQVHLGTVCVRVQCQSTLEATLGWK